MYEIVTLDTVDFKQTSRDLKLNIAHIKSYFDNYRLFKTYPIRTLSYDEIQFVKAIKQVKLMSDLQLQKVIQSYEIDVKILESDSLYIERCISKYTDEESYSITRKYIDFIIQPAILYGNYTEPLTAPLSPQESLLLMSNIAAGIGINGAETVDPKTRGSALSKILDLYSGNKTLVFNEPTAEVDVENLTLDQLDAMMDYLNNPDKLVSKTEVKPIKKQTRGRKKKEPELIEHNQNPEVE